MSQIIRACNNCFILHTGQHYSYEMDKVFLEELELPDAKYNLDVGSGTHGAQTGKMLIATERVLFFDCGSEIRNPKSVCKTMHNSIFSLNFFIVHTAY